MARLRENLPPRHVRLSLLNWAPVRPRRSITTSRAAHLDTFRHVGLTRVARLDFICHSGILPRRETSDSGCPVCFRFLPSSLSRGRREDLEEDRCPASLRQISATRDPSEFLARGALSRERGASLSSPLPPLFHLLAIFSPRINDHRTRVVGVQARPVTSTSPGRPFWKGIRNLG